MIDLNSRENFLKKCKRKIKAHLKVSNTAKFGWEML